MYNLNILMVAKKYFVVEKKFSAVEKITPVKEKSKQLSLLGFLGYDYGKVCLVFKNKVLPLQH